MGQAVRFSVIMPVNLSPYSFGSFKSASNPEDKFVRAVKSFFAQSFGDAELVIVSDGCEIAENIYYNRWIYNPQIQFKRIPKQEQFSGKVRQAGLELAMGDIICYLDHDDMFDKDHLKIINDNFDIDKYDWVYYNDYLVQSADFSVLKERNVKPIQSSIGTSAIAHKRSCNVVWGDGYGHDLEMIQKYLLPLPHAKIPTPQYYVCHCSGLNMDF
jgi:glycosyltransferase involved in cell wall biosynthesis